MNHTEIIELYNKIINNETNNIEFDRNISICILSTFTVKIVEQYLKVEGYLNNLNFQIKSFEYSQVFSEILNESSELNKSQFDYLIIMFRLEDMFPDICLHYKINKEYLNKIFSEFTNILSPLINNHKNKIILFNQSVPYFSLDSFNSSNNLNKFIQSFNFKILDFIDEFKNIYIFDYNYFSNKVGIDYLFDVKMWNFAKVVINTNYLKYLTENIFCIINRMQGKFKKCLALDLDNTLWGGILGDEGIDNIKLDTNFPGNVYYDFQKFIYQLYKSGIILVIVSKNNFDAVEEVFQEHPCMFLKKEYFSSLKINWKEKYLNLIEISNELNISLDSIVFFDDNKIEREKMINFLPEVYTVDVPDNSFFYVETLKKLNFWDIENNTIEDINRGKYYELKKKRDEEKNKISYEDFIQQLNIKLEFEKYSQNNKQRIYQLFQRTNQFNLTTIRYSIEELDVLANQSEYQIIGVSMSDKFGDNGLIAALVFHFTNEDELIIESFVMSCRVMGLTVENLIFEEMKKIARQREIKTIIGKYKATEKNKPVADLYRKLGFEDLTRQENLYLGEYFLKI